MMADPPQRGRFITLEGGEGVGKSTQLAALAQALQSRGRTVITTREPGGSLGAERIRNLLLDPGANDWSATAEALLFAAARADHVEQIIRPALNRGDWVLCDRYVDSSRAYQGARAGGSISDAQIMQLHAIGSGGLLPDRTLLFRLDAASAANRRQARAGQDDRFEQRDADFHAAVCAHFDAFAAAEPARFRIIDASGAPENVTATVLQLLEDLMR